MQVSLEGFILTARSIERQGKTYIECWFLTENSVVKGTSTAQQGVFFIDQKDQAQASQILKKSGIEHHYKPLALKTFEHQDVGGIYFDRNNSLYKAKTLLKQAFLASRHHFFFALTSLRESLLRRSGTCRHDGLVKVWFPAGRDFFFCCFWRCAANFFWYEISLLA